MASAIGNVDWNGLSLHQGTGALAELVRSHLAVRVLLLDRGGEVVDLTGGENGTIFDHLVETRAGWGEGTRRVAFSDLVHHWTNALEEASQEQSESLLVEEEVGFCAQIAPIRVDGEVSGAVVIAGFVHAEKAAQSVESIRQVLPRYLRDKIEQGEGGPKIVQLPREDRKWVERIARSMAKGLGEELRRSRPVMVETQGTRFCGMIGASEAMKRLFRDIEKVARSHSTVLVTGENGTGKELVARAVHRLSPRRHHPFVAVNCAAIAGDLIASELFGHVKGAFSGAHRDRIGLFEAADGGTLLLDEIGDMDHALQKKLLRVLQEGTFLPVGDVEVRKVNVRVICATNCNLEEMVRAGQFRADLYYRIRVINLGIPPLRERKEDVPVLANYFVSRAAARHGMKRKTLAEELLERLRNHHWPGNVRELENEIERLVIMSGEEGEIGTTWLSARMESGERPESEPRIDFEGYALPEAIEYVERTMILRSLEKTGWNKSQTARKLGVSRRNLIRKVARYELEDLGSEE